MEQYTRFGLVPSAWEADVLPLTPILHMAGLAGLEPTNTASKTVVLPLHYNPI